MTQMKPHRINNRGESCHVEEEKWGERKGSEGQQIYSLHLLGKVGAGHAHTVDHDRDCDECAEPPERLG